MIVYCLTFLNGKKYVGVTTNSLEHRYKQHDYCARSGQHNLVYKAWRKYGPPKSEILASFETIEEMFSAEPEYVKSMNSLNPNGYNMIHGGHISPMLIPEIAKRVGEMNRGRKFPPEKAARHSKLMKGRPCPMDRRKKISDAQKGREFTEEHRRNMSLAHKGRKPTPEAIAARAAGVRAAWARKKAEAMRG